MNGERLYHRLPIALQNAAITLEGWRIRRSRYESRFQRFLEGYRQRAFWAPERIRAFRDQRLRQTVEHAAASVPFYRDWFARARLRPEDIRCLEDLAQLPVLSKEEVREATSRFASGAMAGVRLSVGHTSGSTGSGLRFPVTSDFQREQSAVWWRYREWHGLSLDTPCLYFGGRCVVPMKQRRPPFWRSNRASRQLFFSGYHLGPQTAEAYLEQMRRAGAEWLHGYPSLVSLIAQYALDLGFGPKLRWVTTGAENLLPQQKQVIEKAFGVRPVEHYGMAEGVANISLCPLGKLHVDEDFAAVEFLPHPGGGCRVVGTSFANSAFPLLRYDCGDLVEVQEGQCECGRPGRIVAQLDGRQEDFVVTRHGTLLGRLDHIFKDCINVREAQIRQIQPGQMDVCIVRGAHFGPRDEQLLVEETRRRVGDELGFRIVYVDQLPRTARGKLRFVHATVAAAAPSGSKCCDCVGQAELG